MSESVSQYIASYEFVTIAWIIGGAGVAWIVLSATWKTSGAALGGLVYANTWLVIVLLPLTAVLNLLREGTIGAGVLIGLIVGLAAVWTALPAIGAIVLNARRERGEHHYAPVLDLAILGGVIMTAVLVTLLSVSFLLILEYLDDILDLLRFLQNWSPV